MYYPDGVKAQILRSHGTHMKESWHTYEGVLAMRVCVCARVCGAWQSARVANKHLYVTVRALI